MKRKNEEKTRKKRRKSLFETLTEPAWDPDGACLRPWWSLLWDAMEPVSGSHIACFQVWRSLLHKAKKPASGSQAGCFWVMRSILNVLSGWFAQLVRRLRTKSAEAPYKQFQNFALILKLVPSCCHSNWCNSFLPLFYLIFITFCLIFTPFYHHFSVLSVICHPICHHLTAWFTKW